MLIEKNLPSPKNIAQQNGTSLTTLKNTAFFDLKKQSELLKDALSFIEENIASLNLREVSDFLTFNSTLSPYFVQEVTELAKSDLNSADLQNIRSRFVGERDRLAALYNDVLARKKTSEKQLLDYLASQRNLENLDVDLLAQSVFMDSIKREFNQLALK